MFQVVSLLVRCCDVTSRCQSSDTSGASAVMPNPFADPALVAGQARPLLPTQCGDILYNKTK